MNKIKEFTDLMVWQEGHKLVLLIYERTKDYPKSESYSLVDQMRRAAVSVTSNIAEGFGRQTYKEKVQFYYTAQGSLTELKNQLMISHDLHFLTSEQNTTIVEQLQKTHQLLQGLIKKSKTFLS
jgi:four helix bundle protein